MWPASCTDFDFIIGSLYILEIAVLSIILLKIPSDRAVKRGFRGNWNTLEPNKKTVLILTLRCIRQDLIKGFCSRRLHWWNGGISYNILISILNWLNLMNLLIANKILIKNIQQNLQNVKNNFNFLLNYSIELWFISYYHSLYFHFAWCYFNFFFAISWLTGSILISLDLEFCWFLRSNKLYFLLKIFSFDCINLANKIFYHLSYQFSA